MRSDEEIERLLDDWLADEAQPIPRDVLENALESVTRTPQVSSRRRGVGWLWNGPTGVLAAAAVLLVVVAGGLAVDRIGSLLRTESASPEPLQIWDANADFEAVPDENPAPDAYGNPGVWSYLSSGTAHAPSAYDLLGALTDGRWTDPAFINLHLYRDLGGLVVHPYRAAAEVQYIIIGWKSPIAGDVTIRGTVLLVDTSCTRQGSGIGFFVDRDSTTLFASQLDSGGIEDFDVQATVRRGESIYSIVDPGTDSSCDSTLLKLTITTGGDS